MGSAGLGKRMPFGWDARVLTAGALVMASAAVVPAAGAAAAATAAATPRTGAARSGPHVFGWGFSFPASATVTGAHVWVASDLGDSMIELNTATGGLVRILKGQKFGFDAPDQSVFDGTHLWVVNDFGDSVTELNAATGAVVRVIRKLGFSEPGGISSDGSHVWVTNGDTVIELNAATGSGGAGTVRAEVPLRRSGWSLLGRHQRLGGQQRRQFGHRVPSRIAQPDNLAG